MEIWLQMIRWIKKWIKSSSVCMKRASTDSIQSVYSWWIRLLVTQWEALDIYSTFGDEVMEGIKIHIVAARHSDGEMDPWETVVKDLAARVPAPLQP